MSHPKAGRPRGQAPKPEVLEKERQVVALRAQGMTWAQIADSVGYADASGSRDAYMRAASRVVVDDINEMRNLELQRLDNIQSAHWLNAMGGDVSAANLVLKVIESRRKLLGLDAPTNINVKAEVISYDPDSIQAELSRLYSAYALTSNSEPANEVGETTSPTEPDTTGN
jgi:hypothetical protein